jgi:hypothetical protein
MELAFLQKNYLLVPLAILLTVVWTFVANIMFYQDDEQKSYIKTVSTSIFISGLIVYIHTLQPTLENIILDPVPF